MATTDFQPLVGNCPCKNITYSILAPPMVTHCCHCTYCQRETGSAFDLNTWIETSNFRITSSDTPKLVDTPTPTGIDHQIARCPKCFVALYAQYDNNTKLTFVKVGTLAEGSRQRVKPDAHIFTSTKVEWVDLRSEVERGVPVFEEFYEREKVWTKESLERREKLLATKQ